MKKIKRMCLKGGKIIRTKERKRNERKLYQRKNEKEETILKKEGKNRQMNNQKKERKKRATRLKLIGEPIPIISLRISYSLEALFLTGIILSVALKH